MTVSIHCMTQGKFRTLRISSKIQKCLLLNVALRQSEKRHNHCLVPHVPTNPNFTRDNFYKNKIFASSSRQTIIQNGVQQSVIHENIEYERPYTPPLIDLTGETAEVIAQRQEQDERVKSVLNLSQRVPQDDSIILKNKNYKFRTH